MHNPTKIIVGFQKIGGNDSIVFLRAGNDYFNLTYSENPITTNRNAV